MPELLTEITKWTEALGLKNDLDANDLIQKIDRLEDNPEIQKSWERYVIDSWIPWVEKHNAWEGIHKVYSSLFTIYQEQLRLGEEYELILGVGLLTWLTPSGQHIRRHLIVANVLLEFEARLGKFTIRPNTDGANVRPELDMLDIEEQPLRAAETAKTALIQAEDDPWNKECIDAILETLVHSINAQGEYYDTLDVKNVRATTKPIVEFAPTIILRKRSTKGLSETIKKIKERIQDGEDIPDEFADLAEIERSADDNSMVDSSDSNGRFDGETFFPKPFNEEQKRIIEKIGAVNGMLVQGPPGTGKSHTIANLICHLLATGKRILVTAKTPRALQVLEGLLPVGIRPLCINLLGSGLEEKRSLESSVGGILRESGKGDNERSNENIQILEKTVCHLREEKVEIERRLCAIRESETHYQNIAEGEYRGTATQIAQAVKNREKEFGWICDDILMELSCPITVPDFFTALYTLRGLTTNRKNELELICPNLLTDADVFKSLVDTERKALDEETQSTFGADEQAANLLSKSDDATICEIRDCLNALIDRQRKLYSSSSAWLKEATQDLLNENFSIWRELYRITQETITSVEPIVRVADDNEIEVLEKQYNNKTLFEDICKLEDHLEDGGGLGWGPFRPKLVKERKYVLKTVRVNGSICTNKEHFRVLADVMEVRISFEKIWGFWDGRCKKTIGPYSLQLQSLKDICASLDSALSLEALIRNCRNALKKCPHIVEPLWSNKSQVDQLRASCLLAIARRKKSCIVEEIRKQCEEPIVAFLVANRKAHPLSNELLEAIRNRDVPAYHLTCNKIKEFLTEKTNLKKVYENIKAWHADVPKLIENFLQTKGEACWEQRIPLINETWHWAQARTWINEYIKQEDAPSLSKRLKQIEDDLKENIARIASLRAWDFCFSRLQEHHRRHMGAWQLSMRKLGKGTGKNAPWHRREAQKHLNNCREAVPAWVMPLHRIWDTVDPAPGIFDIIIVDEASQCGFEALPLFYLGNKILIVGDDKQISPEAVGLVRADVHRLMEEYLHDFKLSSSFDIEGSLFDHGKIRYGKRQITLREHFRCMPEIIRFSNDLCYRDTPLIPLRQYGPNRLKPTEHVLVKNGFREGSNSRAVNRPEANAIANKIVELCKNPRYREKTMGVITLQGDAQAGIIEAALLQLIGAEEMQKRRLICGNSYSFQGDERDIIFLSMVAATNETIGQLTKASDERRFNVAASRAKEQMWLFHSVTLDDLSESCLRRQLLSFFENDKTRTIGSLDIQELERRAVQDNRSIIKSPQPFDSWFEVDVALEITRKSFAVIPQFEVAGKRIDLVIEGGQARLAVECDGDEWHGVDQYEEDMRRQRILERCGWEFFRVRASAFYSNRVTALQGLWSLLEERGILPGWTDKSFTSETEIDEDSVEQEDGMEDAFYESEDSQVSEGIVGRHPQEISSNEIKEAICRSLEKRPNHTCKLDSLTTIVLKELGVITRGNPRMEFEKRVMRCLGALEESERIEKYKAKNRRIRLL